MFKKDYAAPLKDRRTVKKLFDMTDAKLGEVALSCGQKQKHRHSNAMLVMRRFMSGIVPVLKKKNGTDQMSEEGWYKIHELAAREYRGQPNRPSYHDLWMTVSRIHQITMGLNPRMDYKYGK